MICTECGREFVHIEDDEGICDECWENRFPSIPNEIVNPDNGETK
ncbi:MAG: hypothetical protein ACYCPR_05550 [Thermoplasmataceae archaeon]